MELFSTGHRKTRQALLVNGQDWPRSLRRTEFELSRTLNFGYKPADSHCCIGVEQRRLLFPPRPGLSPGQAPCDLALSFEGSPLPLFHLTTPHPFAIHLPAPQHPPPPP